MRFITAITTFGLMALVSAQSSSSSNVTHSATSSSSSASMTLSPAVTCLQKCGSADVCCQAACVNVPCPSQSQANATTQCAAQCPQGNGTKEETQQYAACQSSCISSLFLTSTGGSGAAATGSSNGASATGTGSGSEASATGIGGESASGSGSGTASATGSAASSSSSAGSASDLKVGFAGASIFGLIVVGLAL